MRTRPGPIARLAWPLAISLALHLCLGWLFAPGSAGNAPRSGKAVTLTVLLASKEHPDPLPVASTAPVPVAPAAPITPAATAPAEDAGNLTQKARFLAPPDLSALEEIPVPLSGTLTLRLDVSALGTVERVTVTRSDPVPKELRDGLIARFQEARLTPARSGSLPVASSLELVIRFETTPARLPREP